jgi:uncharacterized cupredoxin-like copper-binding protein
MSEQSEEQSPGASRARRPVAVAALTLAGLAAILVGLVAGAFALAGVVYGVRAVAVTISPGAHQGAHATTTTPGGGAPGGSGGPVIQLDIKDVALPAGGTGPVFVGPGGVGVPVLFTVKAGQTVTVVVHSSDSMMHTFTMNDFGVNQIINPSGSATFSFTPKKAGTFEWICEVPCGTWVMSHDGYMVGKVVVTP